MRNLGIFAPLVMLSSTDVKVRGIDMPDRSKTYRIEEGIPDAASRTIFVSSGCHY